MTETPMAMIVDAATGEVTQRPLTAEEIAEREAMAAEAEAQRIAREAEQIAKEEAKLSGIAKLMSLGLTEEEAKALVNG